MHRAVCVSLVTGAGAESIGRAVAARLGFRYVDDEVITCAAETAGLDRSVLDRAEHDPSLMEPMVDAIFARAVETEDAAGLGVAATHPADGKAASAPAAEGLRRLIERAIVAIARRGQVVIVAHAASLALRDQPNTLRVHVVASRETRIRRLSLGTTLVGEDEYAKLIDESDLQRAQYLARFYDVREERPTLYDLVINTDVLDLRQVAAIVVAGVTTAATPAT